MTICFMKKNIIIFQENLFQKYVIYFKEKFNFYENIKIKNI